MIRKNLISPKRDQANVSGEIFSWFYRERLSFNAQIVRQSDYGSCLKAFSRLTRIYWLASKLGMLDFLDKAMTMLGKVYKYMNESLTPENV
jgi:hypothetical protein